MILNIIEVFVLKQHFSYWSPLNFFICNLFFFSLTFEIFYYLDYKEKMFSMLLFCTTIFAIKLQIYDCDFFVIHIDYWSVNNFHVKKVCTFF